MAGTRQNGKAAVWKHRSSDSPEEEASELLETWELVEGGFVAAVVHCPAKPAKSYDWRILPAETRALADALRGGTVRTLRQAKSQATQALRDSKSLREQWRGVKRAVVSIARMHGIEADALPLMKFAHELGASSETILRVLSYYSSPDEEAVAAE